MTALSDITREHARKVRDHMLAREKQGGDGEKVSPASVRKELGMLRTVIGYGSRELGLRDYDNPFHGLPIEGLSGSAGAQISARDKVAPLQDKIVNAMRGKLSGDLHLVWRILTGTGCRLGEVTGLRLEDIILDASTPHIRIQWHEARRLKTRSSIRSVPLLGDALEAAQEAVRASDSSAFPFTRYARDGGPDAASAALMKHLRGFTSDKRLRVHSLRHRLIASPS
ncbi:MAG: tyrosine-type recombinase/integrase [Roseobacter sp.]